MGKDRCCGFRLDLFRCALAQSHFIKQQCDRCDSQRQEIVEHTEHEYGRKDPLRFNTMSKMHQYDFQNAYSAGNMGENNGHLSQKIVGKEGTEGNASFRKKHIHAKGGYHKVGTGHKSLRKRYGQRGESEFLFEEVDGSPFGQPAEDEIEDAHANQHRSQRTDMGGFYAQLRGNVEVIEKQNKTGQSQSSYPESDRQHEHKANDVERVEAPRPVKTVTNGGPAKEGAKIIADDTACKRNKAHTGKGKLSMYGPYGKPIVADENKIVEHDKPCRQEELIVGNHKDACSYLFQTVAPQFVIEKPAGQCEDAQYQKFAKDRHELFHKWTSMERINGEKERQTVTALQYYPVTEILAR